MTKERVERRLTAVLVADVAGYSRLMGADEEGTAAAVKTLRREIVDPKIKEHRGRIVHTAGDGLLVEFASVVDAVRCAVDVRREIAACNAGVPTERRIEFRIGINLGDVIVDGTDIFGDGVNVAARLEALAEPGGIYVSRVVRDQVRDKLAVSFEDMGEQQVKNIARPVRVFRVRCDGVPAKEGVTLALPDKPSIAVLPFHNLSGNPEQEFFCDGMAEDIITALSKLRWFFVIARNSTFAYKARSLDVRQTARELGVRYILEGSVRKAGNRLRITAQLIDATTGNHIWADRYDREIVDIFVVQDEITQSVVSTIEPQLYAAEKLRVESSPPESLDAWGCVIRALWHLARITREDAEQATLLLKRAVTLAPRYAKAHSLLAAAELLAVARGTSKMGAALPLAKHHAQMALNLDDTDAWTYFSIALVEMFQSKHAEAIQFYRRAIELNPNFAMARGHLGGALAFNGQVDEALTAVQQAMTMSPQDPFNAFYLYFAAVAYFTGERYAEALGCLHRVLRERPNFYSARRRLAACHVWLGQLDEARSIISELRGLQPDSSIERDAYGWAAHARSSDQERYVAALRKAGLPAA